MGRITAPHTETFLQHTFDNGYGMTDSLVDPDVANQVAIELEEQGYLVDHKAKVPTMLIDKMRMPVMHLLHQELNETALGITGTDQNHLPLFGIRIFDPGKFATTVHRNDPQFGPLAVGIPLFGEAEFSVYHQHQLALGETRTLTGTNLDPEPFDSIYMYPGSAWGLHTGNGERRMPHSGGVVNSVGKRGLLVFHNWM